MLDFFCLGDAAQDNFFFINEASVHCDLRTAECQLSLKYGQKIPVESIGVSLGGNAANVAVGLARLGVKASLATVFGDDDRGAWLKRQLMENGVELGNSQTNPDRQSNISSVIVFKGERTILTYHGGEPEEIKNIPQAQWYYLTSGAPMDVPDGKIALNPGARDLKKGRDYLQPIIDKTEVLIMNKEEAEMLGELGPKITVITDGSNGATVYTTGKTITMPAIGGKAIEATGAGDAFSSGFLAALFFGKDPETALGWGLKNSGAVIQKVGAIAGLLTKEEING